MTIVGTLVASLFAVSFFIGIQHFTRIRDILFSIIYPSKQLDGYKDDLVSAASMYGEYSRLARRELYSMQRSYSTVSRQHKRIGFELGYARKLNALEETIKVNAFVTEAISKLALGGSDFIPWGSSSLNETQQLGRMREVLKHFVRDWSKEGAEERAKTFLIILDEFKKIPPHKRDEITVLVPGSGLARLPWEISVLGFKTTSNEISPYMNLAFQFITSRSTTSHPNQHVIHPFAHWFSHQRSNTSLFRTVTFPDVLPSLAPISQLRHDECDFLTLAPVNGGYHYIVTHYFIDTSKNIISMLQKIYSLLRNGGMWINLGPLLWMSGGQATMELNLEEVLELSRRVGFQIQESSRRTIPSEYTRDDGAMMRWIYEAEFWTALKI